MSSATLKGLHRTTYLRVPHHASLNRTGSARLLSFRSAPLSVGTSCMRDTYQPALPSLCRSFSWSWTLSSAKPSGISTPPLPLEIAPTSPVQDIPELIASAASTHPPVQAVISEATSATIPVTPANVTQDIAAAPSIAEPLNGIGAIPESTTLQALEPGSIAGLGLSSGFPSGWITHMIDYLHLSLGYGWPATILLVQLALRIPLGFLQLGTLRSTARMQSHWKQISALQAQADAAKKSGNKLLYNSSLLRVQTVTQKSGFGVLGLPKIIGTQLLTLTAQAGTFLAIRRLANLPLDDMMATSWAWLPSLTAPDPYYILPVANLLIVQGTLWLQQLDTINMSGAHMLNAIRLISVPGCVYLGTQSSALNLTILIGASLQALQTLFFRAPGIRRMLNIAIIPRGERIEPPGFAATWEAAKGYFSNQMEEAKAMDRAARRARK